jgi:plasmid stabilization system protein ParE
MAYKLVWSPTKRDDRHDSVVFIARDNRIRVVSFGYELISETDRLQEFPELGRIVPEYRNEYIREIVFRPYRIIRIETWFLSRIAAISHARDRCSCAVGLNQEMARRARQPDLNRYSNGLFRCTRNHPIRSAKAA